MMKDARSRTSDGYRHTEMLVLMRHDTSEANLNPDVYRKMADHMIPVAQLDSPAVKGAGRAIKQLNIPLGGLCSWSSPYVRCQQTQDSVLQNAFGGAAGDIQKRESFLLREQEFGDWDSLSEAEAEVRLPFAFAKRKQLDDTQGRFYFRYPNGESRADVVVRTMLMISKIHRSDYTHHLIFLHGVTQRAFRMAWFNRPVEWFEQEPNPPNASVIVIQRCPTGAWMERYLPVEPAP
jgi:broad specificity phosphatase PhoE